MAAQSPASVEDAHLLRLSAQFLDRLGSDPSFAERFSKDPAAALRHLFPELKRAPKSKIAAELDSARELLGKQLTASRNTGARAGGQLIIEASGSILVIAANRLVTLAAQALVKGLLTLALEGPRPE